MGLMNVSANSEAEISKSMKHESTFLNLPSEIRDLIYHYVFRDGSVVLFRTDSDGHLQRQSPLLSILFASRLCYREARSIFYRRTVFHLRLNSEFEIQGPDCPEVQTRFGRNAEHVEHLFYYGRDAQLVFELQHIFPNLKRFEMSLGNDFYHSDESNWTRAMRNARRYAAWEFAIRDALDERIAPTMRDAMAMLYHLGLKRGFTVRLHWRKEYRFINFQGDIDLDEWVFRIRDPDGWSSKVIEIPQNELEPTWGETRLTLPCGESGMNPD